MSKRKLMCFFAPFFLSGCSYLGYSQSPITIDSVGELQLATMEETQRAIIVSRGVDGSSNKYCIEPPADAVGKLSQSLAVQFFREASFSLCQAHLMELATSRAMPSGADHEPALAHSYNKIFAELLHTTTQMLEKEIRYINYSEFVDAKARLAVLQGNRGGIVKAKSADEGFPTE
jgi:hypothetical protein